MAFGGGYGAGTLGSLAFGGAQTNNIGGNNLSAGRSTRRPRTPPSGPPNGPGPQGQPYWYDREGQPYRSYPRPGIDYNTGGSDPTFDDWWDDIWKRRAGDR